MMLRRLLMLACALLLAACSQQAAPDQGALPADPQTPAPSVAPAPSPTSPPRAEASPTLAVAAPSATIPTTPTLITYADPRQAFTILLPENWNLQPLPEAVGVSATAYNASARYLLSLAIAEQPLSETQQAQIVEEVKNGLFASYLVREPNLTASRDAAGRYVLAGTATLTGDATTVEFSLEQRPDGVLILQSWLAPTPLWPEFVSLFKEPMEASLTVDAAALESLRP